MGPFPLEGALSLVGTKVKLLKVNRILHFHAYRGRFGC